MKAVLLVVVMLMLAIPSFAGIGDDNSTNQDQGQAQGQIQGQGQDQGQLQGQGQGQAQAAVAAQGQLGIVGQSSDNSQTTNIGGDENTVTTAVWPTTASTQSKEEKSIYSLFGGIGSNKTEEQIRIVNQMQVTEKLFKDGIITEEVYQADLVKAYDQLKKSNKNQKLFGVLPIAERGCNALNACGLLNW